VVVKELAFLDCPEDEATIFVENIDTNVGITILIPT
jgi:hypothetical protein